MTQLASGSRATMVSPRSGNNQTMSAPAGEMYFGSYPGSAAPLVTAA
ncbi:hypothetical protein [Streptomyces albogriseolus]